MKKKFALCSNKPQRYPAQNVEFCLCVSLGVVFVNQVLNILCKINTNVNFFSFPTQIQIIYFIIKNKKKLTDKELRKNSLEAISPKQIKFQKRHIQKVFAGGFKYKIVLQIILVVYQISIV